MIGRILAIAAISCVLLSASGCGTFCNFAGQHTLLGTPVTEYPIPYGGVAANVKLAVDRPEMWYFAAFDGCLCLVSDTLTLPWVAGYHIRELVSEPEPPLTHPDLPALPPMETQSK
jgi:uncharacterized protein YceK